MSKIAARFGIPLSQLVEANKAAHPDPNKIAIGDLLVIPTPAPSAFGDAQPATTPAPATRTPAATRR
jgi:hypothetical protein